MKAQVVVKLKKSVLDPQGKAILGSLHSMGHNDILSVRQGKIFEVELGTTDPKRAEEVLRQVSQKLLANTVVEDFEVKLL